MGGWTEKFRMENTTLFYPFRRECSRLLLLWALFLSVSGCSPPAPQDTSAAQSKAAQSQSSGPMSLTISPSPARQLVPSAFSVASHPTLPQGTTVIVTLTMPAMAMPPAIIPTVRKPDGSYQGSGSFTMDGDWQAEIAATTAGRRMVQTVSVHVQ